MPTNKFKTENEELRKEAERLRVELIRLNQKVEIALNILRGGREVDASSEARI